MQIIMRKRGEGKTEELIKLASENNYTMVCINTAECMRVARRANKLGLKIPATITVYEFIRDLYRVKDSKGIVIDNLEVVLSYLAKGLPVKAITLTLEEE